MATEVMNAVNTAYNYMPPDLNKSSKTNQPSSISDEVFKLRSLDGAPISYATAPSYEASEGVDSVAAIGLPSGMSDAEYNRILDYSKLTSQAYDGEDNWVAETGIGIFFKGLPDGLLDQDFATENYTAIDKFNLLDGHISLDATLFENNETGNWTLAFRGTEPTSIFDWANDIAQFYGGSNQYDEAISVTQDLKDLAESQGKTLELTGHSLGGGLANAAALATGLDAVCFDAAGLSQSTIDKYNLDVSNADNITHVNVQGDWVSDHNEQMDDTTLNQPPYGGFLFHLNLPECKQYGGKTVWLDKVEPEGTRFLLGKTMKNFATALLNHAWHSFVYQLENKNFVAT